MKTITCVLVFVLFCFSVTVAQDIIKNKKAEKTFRTKTLNATETAEDSIVFKDNSDNHLITIIDEGTVGSIRIPAGSAPSATANKLYNVGSTLFFNGSAVLGGGVTSLNDLSDVKTDTYDIFLGSGSGTSNTGSYNMVVGTSALHSNTSGSYNTAIGDHALYSTQGSNANTANGYYALYLNTGYDNTATGYEALYSNAGGHNNTAFGYNAGHNLTTGSNDILIGNNAQPSAVDVTNEIVLGDGNISSLRCAVNSISSLSDMRDKKNISNLPLGIDFIMTLQPRMFNWDKRDWYESGTADGSKMKQTPTAGFIAQELDEAQINANAEWLNLVLKSNPEKLEATYGNLLPVMVKAIQDLKKENDELKEQNAKLQDRLDKIDSSISSMVKSEVSKVLLENSQVDQKYTKIN